MVTSRNATAEAEKSVSRHNEITTQETGKPADDKSTFRLDSIHKAFHASGLGCGICAFGL
jgi:hypothetical protein